MGILEERQRRREKIEGAERAMLFMDRKLRAAKRDAPPMEPTPEQCKSDPQQEIRLNIEWVAAVIRQAESEGWNTILAGIQPLVDHANAHPKGWRNAFDESVLDEELRAILYKVLDSI